MAEGIGDEPQGEAPDPMAELARERDEYKDQFLRTLAEFQNFRRRAVQEREDLRRFATEELVRTLIPVLDNFDRTIAAFDQGATMEAILEGVKAIDRQLRAALEGVNVKRLNAVGMAFDPEHHEAIASVASGDYPEETVVEELEPGYKMGERVIRPARVKVAKKP